MLATLRLELFRVMLMQKVGGQGVKHEVWGWSRGNGKKCSK